MAQSKTVTVILIIIILLSGTFLTINKINESKEKEVKYSGLSESNIAIPSNIGKMYGDVLWAKSFNNSRYNDAIKEVDLQPSYVSKQYLFLPYSSSDGFYILNKTNGRIIYTDSWSIGVNTYNTIEDFKYDEQSGMLYVVCIINSGGHLRVYKKDMSGFTYVYQSSLPSSGSYDKKYSIFNIGENYYVAHVGLSGNWTNYWITIDIIKIGQSETQVTSTKELNYKYPNKNEYVDDFFGLTYISESNNKVKFGMLYNYYGNGGETKVLEFEVDSDGMISNMNTNTYNFSTIPTIVGGKYGFYGIKYTGNMNTKSIVKFEGDLYEELVSMSRTDTEYITYSINPNKNLYILIKISQDTHKMEIKDNYGDDSEIVYNDDGYTTIPYSNSDIYGEHALLVSQSGRVYLLNITIDGQVKLKKIFETTHQDSDWDNIGSAKYCGDGKLLLKFYKGMYLIGTGYMIKTPENNADVYSKDIKISLLQSKYFQYMNVSSVTIKWSMGAIENKETFNGDDNNYTIHVDEGGTWNIYVSLSYVVYGIGITTEYRGIKVHVTAPPNLYVRITNPEQDSIINSNSTVITWESGGDIDYFTVNINNRNMTNTSEHEYKLNVNDIGGWDVSSTGIHFKDVVVSVTAHGTSGFDVKSVVSFLMRRPNLAITIYNPTDNQTYHSSNIKVLWRVNGGIKPDEYYLRVDMGKWIPISAETTHYTVRGLSNGWHTIVVKAYSNEYGGIEASTGVSFYVNITGEFKIVSPVDGECFKTNDIKVVWYSSQNYKNFEVKVDNGTYRDIGILFETKIKNISAGQHIIFVKENLRNGDYEIQSVKIQIGNCYASDSDFSIKITYPQNRETIYTDSVTAKIEVTNFMNVNEVFIYLNGKLIANKTSKKMIYQKLSNLRDGRYVLSVVGYGKYGNVHSYAIIFKVDQNIVDGILNWLKNDLFMWLPILLIPLVGMAIWRRKKEIYEKDETIIIEYQKN